MIRFWVLHRLDCERAWSFGVGRVTSGDFFVAGAT